MCPPTGIAIHEGRSVIPSLSWSSSSRIRLAWLGSSTTSPREPPPSSGSATRLDRLQHALRWVDVGRLISTLLKASVQGTLPQPAIIKELRSQTLAIERLFELSHSTARLRSFRRHHCIYFHFVWTGLRLTSVGRHRGEARCLPRLRSLTRRSPPTPRKCRQASCPFSTIHCASRRYTSGMDLNCRWGSSHQPSSQPSDPAQDAASKAPCRLKRWRSSTLIPVRPPSFSNVAGLFHGVEVDAEACWFGGESSTALVTSLPVWSSNCNPVPCDSTNRATRVSNH